MVHLAGEDAEDAARWWRAYQVAENEHVDELRKLADAGDEHARRQLASWLADCDRLDELRQRAENGDDHARQRLADEQA